MATNEKVGLVLDLRGLDMVTPVDLLQDGRTPWAKNFRLYAKQSDDRQVAVSSRKGSGFYSQPLVEVEDSSVEVIDSSVPVGVTSPVAAQRIVIETAGRLSRIDAPVSSPEPASGVLTVKLYSTSSDGLNALLSESSVIPSAVDATPVMETIRFLNAPRVEVGDEIIAVFMMQDDAKGQYHLHIDEGVAGAMYSDTSISTLVDTDYSINYSAFISPDTTYKGSYRFNRDDGQNITLAAYGTTMYSLNPTTRAWTSVQTGLSANASWYSFTRADGRVFWVNGYDGLKAWDGTGAVETITDTELPILSQVLFHKDRLFGVSASEKNKIIWSEAPGNPSNAPTNQQWYRAYLSTSFWYIPAPKTGSPITGIISFQDSLIIFTQDNKYVFSGSDKGSFNLRQSTGAKGALSMRGIVSDENFIYFAADDGLYEFNGSSDKNISEERISPLFDGCPNKYDITPVIWKNKVRWYMASSTSAYNDICALYNRGLGGEWELDTETFVTDALYYDDADDDQELIEFSSLYNIAFQAETAYNAVGAPIDFEYRLKYDSMGLPAQKKRIRRYYPIFQGVDSTFKVNLDMDKDFQDSPRTKEILLAVNGATLGNFLIGDDTILGGDTTFKHHRQSYSGSAYYWQLRIRRRGVNNRVAFTGAQYKYRIKRM